MIIGIIDISTNILECKDLMKAQLCLNVLDFCDVYLVSNYCCETCQQLQGNYVPPQGPPRSSAQKDTRIMSSDRARHRRKALEILQNILN